MAVSTRVLSHIGIVSVPTTEGTFRFSDVLFHEVSENGPRVRIHALNNDFRIWLLEKLEYPMSETTLSYADLIRYALNGPVMDELGDAVETTLAGIYALMRRQANGEQGALLTNGMSNIFYVRDIHDKLRTVTCWRTDNSWHISAGSVVEKNEWRAGCRVFSQVF